MSAHTRERLTDSENESLCVILRLPNSKKISYSIPFSRRKEVEEFLERQSEEEDDDSVRYEILAKERIEKYKKSGLVLRGMKVS